LVVATRCMVGLTRGVGAATLRAFVGHLPLEAHVGCAPRALRSVLHTVEQSILATAAGWEPQGMAQGERRPSSGAVEAPCLQRLMRGCMARASGSLLMEAWAVPRT
jgi:hypothetical protein